MAVNAAFALIEYMQDTTAEVLGSNIMRFHPGNWSPKSKDEVFATYKVIQNVDYDQPYIHVDNLTAVIYHTNWTTLQQVVGRLLVRLNQENTRNNPNLFSRGLTEGVRFDDVVARITTNGSGVFIEGTEHFSVTIDIMYQYVELRYPFTHYTRAAVVA